MSFLSPLVLAGLAAVGVPIAIHLLNKFRVRTTDWGAMRFLSDVVIKNQRRVKLDDLILLILRCLLVTLAVLAFARPVLKGFGIGTRSGPVAAAILLDNSASMAQTGGAANHFDLAKEEVRTWLGKQDSQTLASLFLVSARTTPLIGKPSSDFGVFRKSLDDATISDYGSDLAQGVRLAIESLKPITGRTKEIHIYTDGQAIAIRNREEFQKLVAENPDIVIKPIIIGKTNESNLGLTALHPEGTIPSIGQPTRFRIQLLNSGPETLHNVKIDLTLDSSTPAGSATIPVIGPGETQAISAPVSFATSGPHIITASIPIDAFPADNQRSAAVNVISRMDVIIAQSQSFGTDQDQAGFFIANALVPVPRDQAARYYLAPQFIQPADLPATLSQANAEMPAAIFLCDPGPITPAIATALETYVNQGGNLVVLPGDHSDVSTWNTDPIFSKLLPATLAPAVETAADKVAQTWQTSRFTHPITTFWNDPANGSLGSVKFLHYCPMTLKTNGSPEIVTAFASDGQPSVAGWSVGTGSVVLFNASTTPGWTNFPLHPAFVPFIQRLIGYFNRAKETHLNLTPGETFRISVPENSKDKDFSVLRPGTDAARTAGQVTTDTGGPVIRYAATERTGGYQVTIDQTPIASFAVQMDPDESDLTTISEPDFQNLVTVTRTAAGPTQAVPVVLKEYWTALIGCLAVLFVAEAALAHRNSFAR